jgi:predicted nucleic acid-binding protein
MESALLGLVLDSSSVITAKRNQQALPEFIEAILAAHGSLDLSLSPMTVAELVHGIYRAKTPQAGERRREYIEELVGLIPVHPFTKRTAWLVGQFKARKRREGTCCRSMISGLALPPSNRITRCSLAISVTSAKFRV